MKKQKRKRKWKPKRFQPEPEPVVAQDDGLVLEDELPDWLRDDSVGEEEESASLSWLADETTYEEAEAEVEAEAVQPEPEPVIAQDDGLVLEDELPDWLRDDSVGEEEESASLSWLADETTYEEAEAEAEVEAEAVQPEPEPVVAQDDGLVLEDELPDWLRDDSVGEEEESASLSWLADETTYEEAEAEVEVEAEAVQPEPEPVVAQDDGLVLEDELPDWLRDDSVGEEEESASLSWLADETTYEEAEAEAEVEAEAVQPEPEPVVAQDDGLVLEDELPDWLTDTANEDESFMVEADLEFDEVADEGALPNWLQDEVASDELAIDEPVSMTVDEVPDWLDTVDIDEKALPTQAVDEEGSQVHQIRVALNQNNLEEALSIGQSLIQSELFLDQIIDVFKSRLATNPDDSAVYEVVGDAQMQAGYLNQALSSYKKALEKI